MNTKDFEMKETGLPVLADVYGP